MIPRVDSHHHFWCYEDAFCEWMPVASAMLHRDYLAKDIAPLLERCGVTGTVIVQAAQTPVETDWLLDLAKSTPSVLGVVGWVDPEAIDAVDRVEAWLVKGGLVGIRLWNQDDPDGGRLRSAVHSALLAWIGQRDLPIDLLLRPRHLAAAVELIQHASNVRFVVDHGAKPDIARWVPGSSDFRTWYQEMKQLADQPTVNCKLSGLVTEAALQWAEDDLKPYFDALLEIFGPRRLLWGSDWPVALTASSYQRWVDCCEALLSELSFEDKAAIFGGNAVQFYGLNPRPPSLTHPRQ